MNIKKGIIAGAMIAAIGMTTITGVYAKDNTQVKGKNEIAICAVGSEEEFTFKELSKEFKDNISKADYKKAEVLFNKAIKRGDDASKFYDELYKLDLFENEVIEELTFKDFAKEFKKDIKPEGKKEAEALFNKAVKLDEEGKYDEACKEWDKLFELDLFEYEECNFETPTFEEFAKDFKKDLKEEDRQKAKKLYENALQLEKENKIEDAMKVWDELFEMNLFGDEVVVYSIDGDGEFDFDKEVMEIIDGDLGDIIIDGDLDNRFIDGDFDDIIIDYSQPLTFDEFSKEFKKDVKPEVVKKAKELYNKAVKADEESQKAWDELHNMDIFKDIDWTDVDFENGSTKMDW